MCLYRQGSHRPHFKSHRLISGDERLGKAQLSLLSAGKEQLPTGHGSLVLCSR